MSDSIWRMRLGRQVKRHATTIRTSLVPVRDVCTQSYDKVRTAARKKGSEEVDELNKMRR